MDGLKLSTDKLDLAAPDRCDHTLTDFHEISRAAGPQGEEEMRCGGRSPRDAIRSQCSTRSWAMKKETGMKKTSTVRVNGNMIFKGHKLTLGLDLGDHSSCYCVLDETGKIIQEQE